MTGSKRPLKWEKRIEQDEQDFRIGGGSFSTEKRINFIFILQKLDTVRTFPWKAYQQKLVKFPLLSSFQDTKIPLRLKGLSVQIFIP